MTAAILSSEMWSSDNSHYAQNYISAEYVAIAVTELHSNCVTFGAAVQSLVNKYQSSAARTINVLCVWVVLRAAGSISQPDHRTTTAQPNVRTPQNALNGSYGSYLFVTVWQNQ